RAFGRLFLLADCAPCREEHRHDQAPTPTTPQRHELDPSSKSEARREQRRLITFSNAALDGKRCRRFPRLDDGQCPKGWYPLRYRRAEPSARGSVESQSSCSPRRAAMSQVNRRQLLHSAGASAAVLALSPLGAWAQEEKKAGFQLPKLPYAYDALEPHIDAETMQIHHDNHHATYVANLNKALAGHPELLAKQHVSEILRDIERVPKDIRQAVINNGGGHANHTMFWRIMGPKAGGQPSGELAKAIDDAFGSFDKFQAKLSTAAATQFGSGWGWLVLAKGKLEVYGDKNQDSPYLK